MVQQAGFFTMINDQLPITNYQLPMTNYQFSRKASTSCAVG